MKRSELLKHLAQGTSTEQLIPVYGQQAPQAAARLQELVEEFATTFPCSNESPTFLFSTPGRTELGGNHTDHQHGCCLAASVDLDTIACVVPNDSGLIRIKSRHHRIAQVALSNLAIHPEETGSSVSLVRGIAAKLTEMGYSIGGFDAYTTTRVLRGSGLSSSAAFEVLVCTIMNHLFCGAQLDSTQIAQVSQYAENVYFGKPCGLMDQLSCSTGGIVSIDFQNPEAPQIRKLQVDLHQAGYALCIIDTGASHSDLTADFAAIPREMRAVAAFFGQQVLRQVDPADFYRQLAAVRAACGDRAALRAHHFFTENRRAVQQLVALSANDFSLFLSLVDQSGRSSWTCLQNVSTGRDSTDQIIGFTLMAAEHLLAGQGAVRVHGGGFAGTVQAYVPLETLDTFKAGIEAVTGPGSCHVVQFRPVGAARLL